MAITLTQDERIAASRRIVKIPTENASFTSAQTNATASSTIYGQVDNVNKEFFDFYAGIVANYEGEYLEVTSIAKKTFDESDIVASANREDPNLFYPRSDPFNYFLIPMITDEVNGVSDGSTNTKENNLINSDPIDGTGIGINQIIDILVNGFNYGAGTETLGATYSSGATLVVTAAPTVVSVGDYILISDASHAALAQATAIDGVNITVIPITTFTGTISLLGTVARAFTGFSQAVRQSLSTTAANQFILDSLTTSGTNALINKILAWETSISNQLTYLGNNDDDRSTQVTQIGSATTVANTAATAINTWQALSNTGVGGKFDNSPINTINTAANTKATAGLTRKTQIETALGSVVDNSDGTYTYGTASDAIYYQRYQWLDTRIDRAFGSLIRKLKAEKGASTLQSYIDNNNFLLNNYETVVVATLFSDDSSGVDSITVDDPSIFSTGDNVYVTSETKDEFVVVIQDIAGDVLKLNIDIPIGYNRSDLARIYKVL